MGASSRSGRRNREAAMSRSHRAAAVSTGAAAILIAALCTVVVVLYGAEDAAPTEIRLDVPQLHPLKPRGSAKKHFSGNGRPLRLVTPVTHKQTTIDQEKPQKAEESAAHEVSESDSGAISPKGD